MGSAGAVSRLYIANANKKDSGNYSCALADVAAVTVVSVHVLNGQDVSEIRRRESSSDAAWWKWQYKGILDSYHPCDIVLAFEVTMILEVLLRSSVIRMVLINFITSEDIRIG
ncbi:hypothetical protein M0802_000825 [Mischocyttarus mexicanus]|nr:hypothetical protein M0802_000825 [Mischocyttarus mexicanus]